MYGYVLACVTVKGGSSIHSLSCLLIHRDALLFFSQDFSNDDVRGKSRSLSPRTPLASLCTILLAWTLRSQDTRAAEVSSGFLFITFAPDSLAAIFPLNFDVVSNNDMSLLFSLNCYFYLHLPYSCIRTFLISFYSCTVCIFFGSGLNLVDYLFWINSTRRLHSESPRQVFP